jgi:hypothetical protein
MTGTSSIFVVATGPAMTMDEVYAELPANEDIDANETNIHLHQMRQRIREGLALQAGPR